MNAPVVPIMPGVRVDFLAKNHNREGGAWLPGVVDEVLTDDGGRLVIVKLDEAWISSCFVMLREDRIAELLRVAVVALALAIVAACGTHPQAEGEARPSGDGCTYDCGDGQQRRDLDGRAYCECWEAEKCQQMIAHAKEAGGDCLAFPTPCDVPSWFESCDPWAQQHGAGR